LIRTDPNTDGCEAFIAAVLEKAKFQAGGALIRGIAVVGLGARRLARIFCASFDGGGDEMPAFATGEVGDFIRLPCAARRASFDGAFDVAAVGEVAVDSLLPSEGVAPWL
jgi:hypothetical protein